MSKNKKLPQLEEGYKAWKEAYDAGSAGIFSIPVSEAIDYVDKTISNTKNID